MLRPVKAIDKDIFDLIKMLKETKASGDYTDYFEEYDHEDIGG